MSAGIVVTPRMLDAVVDLANQRRGDDAETTPYRLTRVSDGGHMLATTGDGQAQLLWVEVTHTADPPFHGWVIATGEGCATLSDIQRETSAGRRARNARWANEDLGTVML